MSSAHTAHEFAGRDDPVLTGIPSPFDVATNDVRLNGAVIDIGDGGRATAIRRLCVPEAGKASRRHRPPVTRG